MLEPGSWLAWCASLALAFPLLVIALGESAALVDRHHPPVAALLRLLRSVVLPALVVLLFLEHVVALDREHVAWRVFATVFWLCAIYAVLSLLDLLLFSAARDTSWRAKVPPLLRDLSRLFLILLGTSVVLSRVWGVDLGAMLTYLGLGSLVVGLALQDTMKNLFAGVALLAENPLGVGDWIQVNDITGRVVNANWRSVHIQTLTRELMVIPNQVLHECSIKNFSADPVYAERIDVAFARGDRPNRVKAVMRAAAEGVAGLVADPAPLVQVRAFEDAKVVYEITLFVDGFVSAEGARDQYSTRLWYAARRSGLTLCPLDEVSGVPVDDVLGTLKAVPVLADVDDATLQAMLPGTRLLHFGAGEEIIRRGQEKEALYVIVEGAASVCLVNEHGREEELARLHDGQLFGEIGMLGGGKATAYVRAQGDLLVAAIAADALQVLLDNAPTLARALSRTAEARLRGQHEG